MPGAAPPLFFVLNARSGHGDAEERAATIRRLLEGRDRAYGLLVASDPRQLPALAERAVWLARRAGGAVVAVGGDGTLATVAQAALEAGLPFGALPQGTFNYFGRAQGLPLETEAATLALLDASIRPVQVGLLNGQVFLVNASVGLYSEAMDDREAFKRQHGRSRLAALWAGLGTLRQEHPALHLRLDQGSRTRVLRTPMLVVGNNRFQLERLGIAEAPLVERGRLAAIAVRPVGAPALLRLALRGALGRLGEAREIVTFSFRRLELRLGVGDGDQRIKVAMDGEVLWRQTPLLFEVAAQPLRLLAPAPDD